MIGMTTDDWLTKDDKGLLQMTRDDWDNKG